MTRNTLCPRKKLADATGGVGGGGGLGGWGGEKIPTRPFCRRAPVGGGGGEGCREGKGCDSGGPRNNKKKKKKAEPDRAVNVTNNTNCQTLA